MSISGNNSIGPGISGYAEKVQTGSAARESIGVSETAKSEPTPLMGTRKDMEKELDNLNKFLQSKNTHLKFTLHERLNEYYVQVIDDNDTVIREIPSKKIMDMVANMYETMGILIDEKR